MPVDRITVESDVKFTMMPCGRVSMPPGDPVD